MRCVSAVTLAFIAVLTADVRAQDGNILFPVPLIEQRLRDEPLQVVDVRGSRMENDRTQRVVLAYPDSTTMVAKWAKAAPNGAAFNNEPRYEAAAYEIQKLFLEPQEYIVPPTVMRAVPLDWFRGYDPGASPTFSNINSVVLLVQYWLSLVTPENFWDRDRFETDTVYARHFANFNILTHLIRHSDANVGNYLISQSPDNPRLFSVDNGVAFRSEISDRGHQWRDLRVNRLPRATVERLRRITREDLDRALGVVVHFEIRDGQLVRAEHQGNLRDSRGVRRTDEAIQFGLTRAEISDIESRLRRLLQRVDEGRIELF